MTRAEIEAATVAPEILAAFEDPGFYPHPVGKIRREETHISVVFLTGLFVYKVKKPVCFGFLDFSDLERRYHYCKREVSLNQRLSRGVYLGVVAVTRSNGDLQLDGGGVPVEYAVKMRQLEANNSLLALARRGELTPEIVDRLAAVLAQFYRTAACDQETMELGTSEMVHYNVEENFTQTRPFLTRLLDPDVHQEVREASRRFWRRHRDFFQRRVQAGVIRDCHGDLHLDHVYLDDDIQVIDCIEFNDRFRYGDVAADLAFLAMDLDFHRLANLGRRLVSQVAAGSGDPEMHALMDFYRCYRAMVRCKVECLRWYEGDQSAGERARAYLELARAYGRRISRPVLWVFCGLSGSGKTTIAREFGTRLGLRVLHTDVIRKESHGLRPEEPAVAGFGEGIYTETATRATYDGLHAGARSELEKDRSVAVDGTFGRRELRAQARQIAAASGAAMVVVECRSTAETRRRRLQGRRTGEHWSDARLQHFEPQVRAFEPICEFSDLVHLQLDTEVDLETTLAKLFEDGFAKVAAQADSAAPKA